MLPSLWEHLQVMDPIEPPQVAPSRQDLLLGVRDQFLLAERPGNFFLQLATGAVASVKFWMDRRKNGFEWFGMVQNYDNYHNFMGSKFQIMIL